MTGLERTTARWSKARIKWLTFGQPVGLWQAATVRQPLPDKRLVRGLGVLRAVDNLCR
jgi:hypothetical protein